MGKIIWIASYPKSGNTWVRMFLNSYFYGQDKRQELGNLDKSTFGGSSKTSYEKVTTRNVAELSDKEIMELTPLAHGYIASSQPQMAFVKTHNLLSTYHNIPLVTPDVTQCGLHIVRNPLDTVISVADHYGLGLDRAIQFINNLNGSSAPTDRMVRQIFSSWTKNVESWTEEAPFPVLTTRYEDLHEDPEAFFSRIIKSLGMVPDAARVAKAVKHSSFKALKNMEKKGGFSEKSRHSKAFFRSGKTGQWKSKLSDAQVNQMVQANYPQMKKFGYLP